MNHVDWIIVHSLKRWAMSCAMVRLLAHREYLAKFVNLNNHA